MCYVSFHSPLFVTWKKRSRSSGEWRLRGCIGTFTAKELVRGLSEYAVISALRDSRFPAVNLGEVSSLRCDVSLLCEFEYNLTAYDWTIGVHGITIEFDHNGRSYSATYLPEVADEQGWTKEKTIEELVYKAGYRGRCNAALVRAIQLTRYQSRKASCTYEEYCEIRRVAENVQQDASDSHMSN